MLRDLVLSIAVLSCLRLSFKHVFVGVLTWAWLSLMQPHREVYGAIANSLRLNLMVAVVTFLAWYYIKDRKLPQPNPILVTVAIFFAWVVFNSYFIPFPANAAASWDRFWKTLALGLMVMMTATNTLRIHALIWIMAVSLGYYGVKGGLLTIMTGGAKTITGPPGTNIADNNQLALSLLMMLPLVGYLWVQTTNRWVRIGLLGGGILTFLSVVGSYSRGAYIALAALAILGWIRTRGARNKVMYPLAVAAIAYPALKFMPETFYARLNTLNTLHSDISFQGRIEAWNVAYYYARDHFPFGAGFQGPEQPSIYHSYFPGGAFHAAHSIYFQVLGEHGFIGLAIFLIILVLAFSQTRAIRKLARQRPELSWAHNLASMIQLSLFVFCIGGSALSHAYYDLFWIWLGLLVPLRSIVTQAVPQRTEIRIGERPAFAIQNAGAGPRAAAWGS
jgi:putative inorganic carbon (HCO3(-)) transporter